MFIHSVFELKVLFLGKEVKNTAFFFLTKLGHWEPDGGHTRISAKQFIKATRALRGAGASARTCPELQR